MAPIALFPFRHRDPRTGKWIRARYRATREEIAKRHAEWEIIGPAELRRDDPVQMFNPALPMVVRAYEQREYGEYSKITGPDGSGVQGCRLMPTSADARMCKSADEYEAFVAQYME